jgi:High potential iron-sulfur protein
VPCHSAAVLTTDLNLGDSRGAFRRIGFSAYWFSIASPGGNFMSKSSFSRRALVKTLTLGVAAGALAARQTYGAEPVKLDTKDPAAVALGYVENAAQVDPKKYPAFVKGSNCDNCLQLQGSAGNSYRPCSLFKGKLVSVSGWCSGWTAEM